MALAAVLAAVISSGGPILLSSATMFVRDWLPFTRNYDSDRRLRAYRVTTIIYAVLAALAAWVVAHADRHLDPRPAAVRFAMVVPPAIAVGYLIYWRRTTERGAYWGMAIGYGAGMVWFALIKLAVAAGLSAPEGASGLYRLVVNSLTVGGEGLDPSYVTTLVPLVAVPAISLLTPDATGDGDGESGDRFYAMLAGERPVDREGV